MPIQRFLGEDSPGPDRTDCLVLPLPYEGTVSYGGGAALGPQAILDTAATQVEFYDTELRRSPCREVGIAVAEPPHLDGVTPEDAHERIKQSVQALPPCFLLTLGGEHAVTFGTLEGLLEAERVPKDISVLQIDAHADLRNEFEGSPLSHACVMRRIRDDLGIATVHVGIRAIGDDEPAYIEEETIPVFFAPFVTEQIPQILAALTENVYITIDVDGLDPSIMPATGTPVPGGLSWWEILALLRAVYEKKNVLATDIVELAPIPNLHAPNFLAAQLAYKCIGYRFCLH